MNRIVAILITLLGIIALFSVAHADTPTSDMKFISDITIPDDTQLQPGEVFTKTWKLQNTGGVDWLDYSLQFVSGEQMQGVPKIIAPVPINNLTDVSIVFTAPPKDGSYQSWWRLINDKGQRVGNQFYVRIAVGSRKTENKPAGPDTSTMIQMNQPFEVNGLTFVVKDVYRNKAVYEWGNKAIIARGMFAIARFEVTSHVPYTINFTDRVMVLFTDTPGNVYKASYTPFSVARSAQLAAPRFFDGGTTVWETIQPTYANFPMVHTEDVPESTTELFLEFVDTSTNDGHWVHLQHLVSQSQMKYEGEFINAPERK